MGFFNNNIQIISIQRIWNHAVHNALTDLIFFKGQWLCTFRESNFHAGGVDGIIRIITSEDGVHWKSIAYLGEEGIDLRDPKLSVTPDGRLMLLVGGSVYRDGKYISRQPRVSFSGNSVDWTSFTLVLKPDEWLWRVTWHQGKAYGISYFQHDKKNSISLFESEDGISYRLITPLEILGAPTEATVRFLSNGQMVALVRRDRHKQFDNHAWIGISSPPYTDWLWRSAAFHFGGPDFTILKDQSMWAAGRVLIKSPYGLFPKTVFALMELDKLKPLIFLPSGEDTSYPGIVYREGEFWISYYSGHEGNTAIYLARFKLLDKLTASS